MSQGHLSHLSLPSSWDFLRFDRIFSRRKSKGHGELPPLSVYLDIGVVPRDSRDDNHNRLGADLDNYLLVEPGDLVFNKLRTWQGGLGWSSHRGIVSPAYFVCVPNEGVHSPFVSYLLRSNAYLQELTRLSKFMPPSQFDIEWQHLRTLPVALPGLEAQRFIAKFTEEATNAIDGLITKKEQLLEMLQKKRRVLITQAVTKGLDPTVPMKDSGIDWLGSIPAHWSLRKLGHLSRIGNGSTPRRDHPPYWLEGDIPWINSSYINNEIIISSEDYVTKLAVSECHLPSVPSNSVLVAITGEGQTRGRAALLSFRTTINQHLAFICPTSPELSAPYLWRALQSAYTWLRDESSGAGSTRAALTCGFLKAMLVPVPPRPEQDRIVEALASRLERLTGVESKTRLSIERLREYRQALITAAVTGQLAVAERIAEEGVA